MIIKERIEGLRGLMLQNRIDAYIIPSTDAHQSEYVAEHWKCRKWISGFTGSAGLVLITSNDAILWTDGRYYIQAERELENSGIRLFKMGDTNVPTYTEYIETALAENSCIGFDGSVFSVEMYKNIEDVIKRKNISLKIDKDLIGELWEDRPLIPTEMIYIHDTKYAGKSRIEKLNEVRAQMKEKCASYYLLASLDDIAWLLNIRGNDVPNNPIVICYAVIGLDKCYLFIENKKVSREVYIELKKDGIELKGYNHINEFLGKLTAKDKILFDKKRINANLYKAINEAATKIDIDDITTNLKAIKNNIEIENFKQCQIYDGIAMIKFIKWLKESINKEEITEINVEEKLEGFRREIELYVEPSFDTIAAYKDHAAMMHYKASLNNQYILKPEGFLLVDSGGQYFNGTSDITRTIPLGKLTFEEKRDYTLVLKANIALDRFKFLYGSTGSNLDVIPRKTIWEYGMDYKCGTGHGIGFFLNVHEGPQRISPIANTIKLEKGMLITNEPGIYKESMYGIRIENILLVVEDEKTDFGKFMKFETVTYCPIDTTAIIKEMLNKDEIEWLNNYNKNVYLKLSPYLNNEFKEWLFKETKAI